MYMKAVVSGTRGSGVWRALAAQRDQSCEGLVRMSKPYNCRRRRTTMVEAHVNDLTLAVEAC